MGAEIRPFPAYLIDGPLGLRPGPGRMTVPTRDEITKVHGDPQQAPLIHRIRDSLEAFNMDQPGNRCTHGVNVTTAGCGRCEGL